MPEGLVELGFNGHDGTLVDLQLDAFGAERGEPRLIVDPCPDPDPQTQRLRYLCIGHGRFFTNGDIPKLAERASSGNIDWMRMDFAETTEILVLLLFGGYLEAEAANFTLTELNS